MVCSPAPQPPIAHEHRGGAVGFGYLRELFTVSKMISSAGVTAMPTSADCCSPAGRSCRARRISAGQEIPADRLRSSQIGVNSRLDAVGKTFHLSVFEALD